jgi:hypothetical protein
MKNLKVKGPEKEFEYIRCQEMGIQYKKLVRSYGSFRWGRSILFIHKAVPKGWPYVISDRISGMAVLSGLQTPTVRAAKLFLARNLTDAQDEALDRLPAQRLLSAYKQRRLRDLPYRKQVEKRILFALQGVMTSNDPF